MAPDEGGLEAVTRSGPGANRPTSWARLRAATAEVSVERSRARGWRRVANQRTRASSEARAAQKGVGMGQLNFYVVTSRAGKLGQRRSLQYRRFLLAHAMTGDFAAAWLPSVLVPLVGILGPAVAMALLFNVIEARD